MSATRAETAFLSYQRTIGLSTMEGRGFYYPADTAIGADEKLYVVSRSLEGDARGVRVTVCNPDSEYFGTFASSGEEDGQLIWPTAIDIDPDGRVFITDEYTNRISIFDTSGDFRSAWGVSGTEEGQLDGPSGLVLDGDNNVYVADHQNHRIQKFTSDGQFLLAFGSLGDGEGQLNLPWGMTIDGQGDLYVADWRNDRIQKFAPEGRFLATYGSPGRGDGQFHRPASVAVDPEGYMYVADWGNERVQVLDPSGAFVTKLRGEATDSVWALDFLRINVEEAEARARANLEPKMDFFDDDPHEESSHIEKYFWAPVSVKLDSAGRLYVTESNRHRIQIYQRG